MLLQALFCFSCGSCLTTREAARNSEVARSPSSVVTDIHEYSLVMNYIPYIVHSISHTAHHLIHTYLNIRYCKMCIVWLVFEYLTCGNRCACMYVYMYMHTFCTLNSVPSIPSFETSFHACTRCVLYRVQGFSPDAILLRFTRPSIATSVASIIAHIPTFLI